MEQEIKATIKTSEIDRLRQECERLTNKLNDWSETYNAIIEDKTCVSDEYHCGCVPALREEIGRLRIALEVIGNVPSAYLTACEKRMKTIAKEALH